MGMDDKQHGFAAVLFQRVVHKPDDAVSYLPYGFAVGGRGVDRPGTERIQIDFREQLPVIITEIPFAQVCFLDYIFPVNI
jgi:hypothetical protein